MQKQMRMEQTFKEICKSIKANVTLSFLFLKSVVTFHKNILFVLTYNEWACCYFKIDTFKHCLSFHFLDSKYT